MSIRALTILISTVVLSLGWAARSTTSQDGTTLSKLVYTDIDAGFEGQPASEVLRFLFEYTNVNGRLLPIDANHSSGIDLTTQITLPKADRPALNLLQDVLEQCSKTDPCTWQIRRGTLEVSSKSRLATESMMVVTTTPIDDLLTEIPDYDNPPNLNPGGGQGGGGEQSGGIGEFQSKQQRLDNLINLITRTIEPEAWERRGGNWASLQVYRGTLVIRAPRWIQRQINGFEYAIPTPKGRMARTLRASGDQIRVEVPLSERMRKQYDQ